MKRTAIVTLSAAAVSISLSTGVRLLIGAKADTITIIVRILLPFVIAIPISLVWFVKLERLDEAYRSLVKKTNELAKRASTDPLTGLLNRRSFAEQFDTAIGHAIGGSFILADIDYLKAINDRYGHLAGDDAIVATANALRSILGEESFIARIGGDEFCAFVPRGDVRDLGAMLAEINRTATLDFQERSGLKELSLSISAGHQRCKPQTTFREMIAHTDSELYRKKQNRRGSDTPLPSAEKQSGGFA